MIGFSVVVTIACILAIIVTVLFCVRRVMRKPNNPTQPSHYELSETGTPVPAVATVSNRPVTPDPEIMLDPAALEPDTDTTLQESQEVPTSTAVNEPASQEDNTTSSRVLHTSLSPLGYLLEQNVTPLPPVSDPVSMIKYADRVNPIPRDCM